MEELIEMVNRLQEVFTAAGVGVQSLDLPQVVVVGAQSSGKSSVLEHLAGRSFLPRGAGVVTRCPLELQMTHADATTAFPEEYAIFQHSPTKVFTDYGLISKEIEDQMGRLAGSNKGICSTAIVLRLFSRSKVQLTLVDLPGLTKVPVGDQPPDVEQQTRQLSMRYVTNPNCIILAVTPANADMATCESLKIAREVDPEGVRTLAVVTKLDLMDSGTDGRDMLSGRVIPVKLGIVGVVNRSQKAIIEGKSVKQSLKDEATFFHNKYKDVAHLHGSPYLAKSVQTILIDRIRKHLPNLKDKIGQKLEVHRKELRALAHTEHDKSTLLLVDVITRFSATYCSAIEGNLASIQTKELSGGARINYVFQDSLGSALMSIDPVAELSNVAVMTAVKNASGVKPALFVPEVAFELLVKRQMRRLRDPCLQCVHIVYEELVRIVQDCVDHSDLGLYRFPNLQNEIYRVATDLLRSRLPLTNQMVNDFIDVQLAYINTWHPDFLANSATPRVRFEESLTTAHHNALAASDEQNPHAEDKSFRDCRLMKELVISYFAIVRQSVQDVVPKTIMHLMVNYVSEQMQSELVVRLYGAGDADRLLQEGAAVAERRQEAADAVAALGRALEILADVKPTLVGLSAPAATATATANEPNSFHLTRLSSHSVCKVASTHR